MASTWGENIKLSIFGGSHTEAIGVVLDNLPPNEKIDMEKIRVQMARRAPGKDKTATTRLEADEPQVLSGLFNGVTTGAPLAAIIANTNTRSKDYSDLKIHPRPGHADYTASVRYDGANDIRGGGHFSGRLTACLVFAGAVCRPDIRAPRHHDQCARLCGRQRKRYPVRSRKRLKRRLKCLKYPAFLRSIPPRPKKKCAPRSKPRDWTQTASAASSSAPQSVSRRASAVLCSAALKTSLHRFYTASPPSKVWSSARALMLPVCVAAKITTRFTTTKMVSSARKRTTRAAFWAASQRHADSIPHCRQAHAVHWP